MKKLAAALLTLSATTAALVPVTAQAATALPAPASLTAAVTSTGQVKLTWPKITSAVTVTYWVSSTVGGVGCVTTATTCTLNLTSPRQTRFSAAAATSSATSAAVLSNTIATRVVLIVAGQSNAMGANSFAIDPSTKLNYFAAPYANGADTQSTIQWSNYYVQPAPTSTTGLVALNTPQVATLAPTGQIFGPEIGLARQIFTDTGVPVTILKSAYPGSALATGWCPSCALYTNLKTMVNNRIASDAARGVADIASAPFAVVKESSAAYIQYLQANNGCGSDFCAAFIAGDAAVRSAVDSLQTSMPDVVVVDSLGLPRWAPGNNVHLTNVGELAIGQQLATSTEAKLPLK